MKITIHEKNKTKKVIHTDDYTPPPSGGAALSRYIRVRIKPKANKSTLKKVILLAA